MINNFCTHFDSNYLAHGLTLIESINRYSENCMIYVIAMDNGCYSELKKKNYSNVKIINSIDVELEYPELNNKKSKRSKLEYFFTFSPAVCKYVFNKFEHIDMLTYLDADLYFFDDPSIILEEIKDSSIAIIEHNFSFFSKSNIKYGRFNVGWVTFSGDKEGQMCLNNWFEDCLDWCYQIVEKDRYADQKYLDLWPEQYPNLKIIKNKGANLATWNVSNYRIQKKNNQIFIDDNKLVFYHFANLIQISNSKFKTNLSRVLMPTSGIIKEDIYIPYLKHLSKHLSKRNYMLLHKKKIYHKSFFINILADISRKIRDTFYKDIIELH